MNDQTDPEAFDDDSAERQERDEAIIHYFERAASILNAYQSHQETPAQLRMSTRAMQLALGFHLAAGARGPTELAKACGMEKWAVTKCVNEFIEKLKLSPLPGQRDAEARRNMREARIAQVTKGTKPAQRAIARILKLKDPKHP